MRRPGLPLRSRRHLRAEPGTRGYRGILTVIVLIALVAGLAVAGVFDQVVCRIDSSCRPRPQRELAGTGLDPGALPAATNERAIATGAGVGVVPPGRHRTAAGKSAVRAAGTIPDVATVWAAQESGQDQARPPAHDPALVGLDALPCGSEKTGPCDAWDGLRSDSTAEQSQGPNRLAMLGLDRFAGSESETQTVDLTLPAGAADTGAAAQPSSAGTLYRNVRQVRDNATTTSWSWQDSSDAVHQVRAERTNGTLLHSLTIISAQKDKDGRVTWETGALTATDSNRDALDAWLEDFAAGAPSLPEGVTRPTDPVDAGTDVLVRLMHASGQVTRETLTPGPGFPGLTPQLLRDDPTRGSADLPVASAEDLGPAGPGGLREFKPREGA